MKPRRYTIWRGERRDRRHVTTRRERALEDLLGRLLREFRVVATKDHPCLSCETECVVFEGNARDLGVPVAGEQAASSSPPEAATRTEEK